MRFLDDFRDPERARAAIHEIERTLTRPWVVMEICGGQTHSIVRNGLDQLIPGKIELVHGPGCPVCVTPLELIDRAIVLAGRPDVIFTSFGDMLRVPGSRRDLLTVKSEGGDIRIVYSPLDAVKIARVNRNRRVIFFAVGFETTAPATAAAVRQAKREGLDNFMLLVSHVLVPPAMTALLDSPHNRVQAYLAAGHVCAVTGWEAYRPIADKYRVPIVVTGFEPLDILIGVLSALRQLESGESRVENCYGRAVQQFGNRQAQNLVSEVYEVTDRQWRGLGLIPQSGLRLRSAYADHDAERVFDMAAVTIDDPGECVSGLVLQGRRKPIECPMFGNRCTPLSPMGATMVSSEGACAAYYRYHRAPSKK